MYTAKSMVELVQVEGRGGLFDPFEKSVFEIQFSLENDHFVLWR